MKTKAGIYEYWVRTHTHWTMRFSDYCESREEFDAALDREAIRLGRESDVDVDFVAKADVSLRYGDDIPAAISEAPGPFLVTKWEGRHHLEVESFDTMEAAVAREEEIVKDIGWDILNRDRGGHAGPTTRVKFKE
jgi:hypothetical protein